ncbi:MAG: RimK/LysX family protein [Verrucomicrobiota bacterium]
MKDEPPIGWREWIALPDLGVEHLKVKIDTGARSSALHVENLQVETRDGIEWATFSVRPARADEDSPIPCEAEIIEYRTVTDSGGHKQQRPFIKTLARLGDVEWEILVSLTTRENMLFPMLLGRTAMAGVFQIDPSLSYTRGRFRTHETASDAEQEEVEA